MEDPGWPKYIMQTNTWNRNCIVFDRLSPQLVCSLRIAAIIYQQTLWSGVFITTMRVMALLPRSSESAFSVQTFLELKQTLLAYALFRRIGMIFPQK